LQVVNEIARSLLGLSVALLNLAKNREAITSAVPRIRSPQSIFTVSALVDTVAVGEDLEYRPEFIFANC
jgi:hypothetical protein